MWWIIVDDLQFENFIFLLILRRDFLLNKVAVYKKQKVINGLMKVYPLLIWNGK